MRRVVGCSLRLVLRVLTGGLMRIPLTPVATPPPPTPVLLFLALSSWELACQQCACKDAREAERESEAKKDVAGMQPDIRHTRQTDSQK